MNYAAHNNSRISQLAVTLVVWRLFVLLKKVRNFGFHFL